jgi:hypothetical protein
MTEYERYSLLIEAVGITVTLVAVAIAIWGERIRQIWTKPQLRISLHDPVFNTIGAETGGWYYLILVTNDRLSSPAQNVRLLLTKVWRQSPDGSWYEQKFSGPTQVAWRWKNVSPQYPTIGPESLATFGCLLEHRDSFKLQLYLYPNNLDPRIRPNKPTRLELQAVSDTAKSKTLTIEVVWDGKWVEAGDQIQNHCVVKEISL